MARAYFSFSTQHITEHKDSYRRVLDLLKADGLTIVRNWLDSALKRASSGKEQESRAPMYKEIMDSIRTSDICIFDVTVKSMGIGQQITYAIERGKPVLVVSSVNADIPLDMLLISGSRSGLLELAEYKNLEQLEKIVKRFIKKRATGSHVRFNLNMESYLFDFIEKKALKERITKTDAIKLAIQEMLEREG